MSRTVPKRTFRRLVHITEDQNTVCNETTKCIHQLDIIMSKMIPIVEGRNTGDVDKIKEIKDKLDEIGLLVNYLEKIDN